MVPILHPTDFCILDTLRVKELSELEQCGTSIISDRLIELGHFHRELSDLGQCGTSITSDRLLSLGHFKPPSSFRIMATKLSVQRGNI